LLAQGKEAVFALTQDVKYFDGAVEFSRRAAALKAAERAQASSDEGVLCDVQFVEQFDL
jgi:hypothetical protein